MRNKIRQAAQIKPQQLVLKNLWGLIFYFIVIYLIWILFRRILVKIENGNDTEMVMVRKMGSATEADVNLQ